MQKRRMKEESVARRSFAKVAGNSPKNAVSPASAEGD